MPTILKTKNSVTTTVVPTSLAQGELAVNITDKKIWVGNAATTPILLVGGGSDGAFANLSYTGTLTGGTGIVNLGSGQFYKDASGNVGIGSTSPVSRLEVKGPASTDTILTINSTSTNVSQRLNLSANGTVQASLYNDGAQTILNSVTAIPLIFRTTDTERMRIDTSGNVGIGTASPTSRLHLSTSDAVVSKFNSTSSGGPLLGLYKSGTTIGFLGVSGAWIGNTATDIALAAETGNGIGFFVNGSSSNTGGFSSSGNFSFNSGYGSPATAYGCRAWVQFDGAGTVAIRGSGNVSSITDNGVGQYTLNFTTAMPDANYSLAGAAYNNNAGGESLRINTAPTTSSVQVLTSSNGNAFDSAYTTVAIFR
jgi:hypothetical protein